MNLGEKIFELRKEKNLTQDDVAEKLNVTRQTVSKWETNQSTPDFDKINPLCDLFEITPNELFKGEKEDENEAAKNSINNNENYENMTKNQIKRKSAEVVSSSILIFFIAIAFAGIGENVLSINSELIGCIFLLLIGIGTARIVKHYMSVPKFEKTKKEEKQDKIVKQINDIIGAIGLIIYFIVSFTTMAWHITWVIFIIIGMINQTVKLFFMLKEEEIDEV